MDETLDAKVDSVIVPNTSKTLYDTSNSIKVIEILSACDSKGEEGCGKSLVFKLWLNWMKNPPFVKPLSGNIVVYTTTE